MVSVISYSAYLSSFSMVTLSLVLCICITVVLYVENLGSSFMICSLLLCSCIKSKTAASLTGSEALESTGTKHQDYHVYFVISSISWFIVRCTSIDGI